MKEWRDIPGYEKLYQASNGGEIRTCEGKTTSNARYSKRVWKQRILKPKIQCRKCGRKDARVNLWKNGDERTLLVARLVALAWCEGYEEGMTVNHINGNPLDNRAENLEWVSLSENIKKGFREGLYSKTQIPITLVDKFVEIEFSSMSEADRFLGRSEGYISNVLKRNKTASSICGEQYRVVKGA